MITGVCLCGALRYEVEGPLQELLHCHCSMCRKHHGAPFASLVTAPLEGFRWLRGEEAVVDSRSSTGRVRRHCRVCGSVAPVPLAQRVLLPAGNLSSELEELEGRHMFVGSKAPWHVVAGALPQHEAAPPGWPQQLGAPLQSPSQELSRPAESQLDGTVPGSCACGAVTFSVTGAPMRWLQCHCSRCRRGRSTAHGSNTFYPASQFAWRSGRELVRKYKVPEAERFTLSFCVRCGGAAPVERDSVPFVLVPASLFDAEPGARPQGHIFVASKAPWYSIADGLPQFAELPPA